MWRLIFVFLCFSVTLYADDDLRTWRSGKFKKEAKFNRLDDSTKSVVLQTLDGKELKVPLIKLSDEDKQYVIGLESQRLNAPSIGAISFIELPIQEMKKNKLPIPKHVGAVYIVSIPNGSPAYDNGLRESDVVYQINDTQITSLDDIVWVVRGLQIGADCRIQIERLVPFETPETPGARKSRSKVKITKSEKEILRGDWEDKTVTLPVLSKKDVLQAIEEAPPIRLGGYISENSIGIPVVNIAGRNMSDKTIVAFIVELACFDRFDKEVRGFGGLKPNKMDGICQQTIKPDSTLNGGIVKITLNGYETATVVKMYIKRVKFDDGSEWISEDGILVDTLTTTD